MTPVIPIIVPMHTGGASNVEPRVFGIIILVTLLYVAWLALWTNKYIYENWSGWVCGFLAALPVVVFSLVLIFGY
jgi:hypothetical protein